MKIAVPYENGAIYQHFGRTESFKLYDVEDGGVAIASVLHTNGNGHGALAGLLKERDVDTLICGGIGEGAQKMLAAADIRVYGGVTGDADQAVAELLKGTLRYQEDVQCSHHGEHHHHGEGHTCHH